MSEAPSSPRPAMSSLAAQSPPAQTNSPQPDHMEPFPQLPFVPFFTLVEDSITASHHHPTVHYIFSDDDEPAFFPTADDDTTRSIVVECAADSSVISAQSLSKDFQVVGVNVTAAPTWGGGGSEGLMLTIKGISQLEKVKKVESLDELAVVYRERMETLRRVIEFAEKTP